MILWSGDNSLEYDNLEYDNLEYDNLEYCNLDGEDLDDINISTNKLGRFFTKKKKLYTWFNRPSFFKIPIFHSRDCR